MFRVRSAFAATPIETHTELININQRSAISGRGNWSYGIVGWERTHGGHGAGECSKNPSR